MNRILLEIRILIAKECEKISKMSGEIEVDESYFGARRVRGKRGRGAGRKTLVFLLRAMHSSLCKKAHYRIKHSANEFANGRNHI